MRAKYKAWAQLPKLKRQPSGCPFCTSLSWNEVSKSFRQPRQRSACPSILLPFEIARFVHGLMEYLELGILVGDKGAQFADECFLHFFNHFRVH